MQYLMNIKKIHLKDIDTIVSLKIDIKETFNRSRYHFSRPGNFGYNPARIFYVQYTIIQGC